MIHINSFAQRQTPTSRFSYFSGTEDELGCLVRDHFDSGTQGYRPGVLEVSVPVEGFFSGIVELAEGDELVGGFDPRRPGEDSRKWVAVPYARKMPAKSVTIILYSSELLAEGGDNELAAEDGNWEVISINASPCESGREPMPPETLMANYFGEDGGTDTKMTPEEFVKALAESRAFWKNKAMCAGEE